MKVLLRYLREWALAAVLGVALLGILILEYGQAQQSALELHSPNQQVFVDADLPPVFYDNEATPTYHIQTVEPLRPAAPPDYISPGICNTFYRYDNAWIQNLLSDPSWNQPYIQPRESTELSAPSGAELLRLTQEALANPPAHALRPVEDNAVEHPWHLTLPSEER
jgi:hypothetical protein